MIWCSTCLTGSGNGSIRCLQCGQVLSTLSPTATRVIAPAVPESSPTSRHVSAEPLPEDHIAIYVGESTEPIVVQIRERVTLGRFVDGYVPDMIDFTQFDGYKLGISRNHAVLVWIDHQLYIQDAGSINGTWLNGQRLKPYELYRLASGMNITLGQIMLYIYY